MFDSWRTDKIRTVDCLKQKQPLGHCATFNVTSTEQTFFNIDWPSSSRVCSSGGGDGVNSFLATLNNVFLPLHLILIDDEIKRDEKNWRNKYNALNLRVRKS